MLYSYDVFDTCLSRLYAYPRDLFLALGLHLAPQGLPAARRLRMARSFQRRRVLAEKAAYRRSGASRTATLDDIYCHFHSPHWLRLGRDEVKALELEFERQAVYRIPAIARELDSLLSRGERVLFVSDMYVGSGFIAEVFDRLHIAAAARRIYVSSEARATKSSGQLFRMVLAQEGVVAGQVLHVGDDLHADVHGAQAQGVRARHFPHSTLTHHERNVAGGRRSRTVARSRLAALGRKWRLHGDPASGVVATRDSVAYATIAPFLLSFVLWVLGDAQQRGIRRLYFVARDGEVLYTIARAMAPIFPAVEARYLHGSRRAWVPASIVPGDRTWLRFVFVAGESNRPCDLLARLGVPADDLKEYQAALGARDADWTRDLSEQGALRFLESLLSHPEAGRRLVEASAGLRADVLSYLRGQGLFDGTLWALVDLGWAFACQAALNRIVLHADDALGPVRGYYLGARSSFLPTAITGPTHCYLQQPGSIFARRATVVEHVFTPATHASTLGYQPNAEHDIVPRFGPELRCADELEYALRLKRIVLLAAEDYVADVRTRRILDDSRGDILRHAQRLLSSPTAVEAGAFVDFGAVLDPRHDGSRLRPLCRPWTLGRVMGLAVATLHRRPGRQTDSLWPEGAAALSSPATRRLVRALLGVTGALRRMRGQASAGRT